MHRLTASLIILASLIVSCSPSGSNAIDGWPLGSRSCYYSCEQIQDVAAKALDDQFRGHSKILYTAMFAEGTYRTSAGKGVQVKRSGGLIVVLFTLDGGVRHAIGVHCGVGLCAAVRPLRQGEIDLAGIP
jgi:hypothetical protein